MATIKQIFEESENGALTWEEFQEAVAKAGAKFEDINEGNYFSKRKHSEELNAKLKEIETLTNTLSTRDTDLAELQKKLEEAGTDAAKLATLSNDFTSLQTKYDEDVKNYKEQLQNQAYEFAVKELAATKQFSSQAAKRDFTQAMIAKKLQMENGKILGADDFVNSYLENNEDAFIQDYDFDDDFDYDTPQFVDTTPGGDVPIDKTGGFASAFHFAGVREIPGN